MIKHMLTTVDNPFNPFSHFDEWYQFDTQAGYHSSSLLARIVVSSNELSDTEQDLAIERAIDEIVMINASGMHRKISELPIQPRIKLNSKDSADTGV